MRSLCQATRALWSVLEGEGEGGDEGGRQREQQIERDTEKESELKKVWATVQPIWDAHRRQSVPEVTDKADPIFVECPKVRCEKMSFRRE